MDAKEKVLATMKEAGQPLNAGKIAELSGLDRKEVDAAMKQLKTNFNVGGGIGVSIPLFENRSTKTQVNKVLIQRESIQLRLAGGPKVLTDTVNIEEWANQAEQYEEIRGGSLWNRFLQMGATMMLDHPFAAVRVREALNWAKTDEFCDFTCVKRLTCLLHCCQYFFFCVLLLYMQMILM